MFSGKKEEVKATKGVVTTLIGPKTDLLGDIRFSGGLHLEGTIKGNVLAEDNSTSLMVGDSGVIEGEVHVNTVTINGTVVGKVFANMLKLQANAKIEGDIQYASLEMDHGARVHGHLKQVDEQSFTLKAHASSASTETDATKSASTSSYNSGSSSNASVSESKNTDDTSSSSATGTNDSYSTGSSSSSSLSSY